MANGGLMAVSVILGFLIVIGMHCYYPENSLTQVVETAAMNSPMTGEFALGPLMSYSVGILIEYFIVVFAVYLFFRGITKSFGR